jgi:hypothetical protein
MHARVDWEGDAAGEEIRDSSCPEEMLFSHSFEDRSCWRCSQDEVVVRRSRKLHFAR